MTSAILGAIAALCMLPSGASIKEAGEYQLNCQKYYVLCMDPVTGKLPREENLAKCIVNRRFRLSGPPSK